MAGIKMVEGGGGGWYSRIKVTGVLVRQLREHPL